MLKFYISFVVLGAVFAYTKHVYVGYESPDTFSELPCISFGGLCVKADDCPEGKLENITGLCPEQQPLGVECCYGLPKSETRCSRRGGECKPRGEQCPERLTFHEASDCEASEQCCILVK